MPFSNKVLAEKPDLCADVTPPFPPVTLLSFLPQMTFSNKILAEKLDVVRLSFYSAPIALACLAPFYWIYEVGGAYDWANQEVGVCLSMVCVGVGVCLPRFHSGLRGALVKVAVAAVNRGVAAGRRA